MKRGLKGLLVLIIVSLVALVMALNVNMVSMNAVVSFLGAGNNATGVANGNFKNLSSAQGGVVLNISFIANGTTNSTLTNVTLMFSNMTDAYMYNTTIHNTSANQTYFQNTSFNTALLADGVYNVSINYTNSSSDSGQNVSVFLATGGLGYNITVDTTAPNVTMNLSSSLSGLPVANGSNFSASKGNVSINFTIYDFRPVQTNDGLYSRNLWNISEVRFVFDNGTGTDFNVSSNLTGAGQNGTVDNRSGVWTVNYNLSSLAEGSQGVIVYANDTFNNTRVVIFNFTVDRSVPNVTLNTSTTSAGIPLTDGSNFSAGKLNVSFNASIFDNFTSVNTVLFVFSNGTGVEFNRTADNRSGVWTVNYNASSLAEGKVSIRVVANDTVNNINDSFTFNFTVDRSVPNVTLNTSTTPAGIPIQDGSNFSASKYNLSFNASVFDNVTSVNNVIFWFDNGTGTDFNITAINVSGKWTVNYNVSSLFEGKQGVRVLANDSANNVNDSFFFNFTIDRTASVLTLATSDVGSTSAKVIVTNNESVTNCTYASVAGAQGSAGSGNFSVKTTGDHTTFTKTFSSLSASTGYQIEVTCTDYVGYRTTNALSWSTTAAAAAANGGSGSGGSGGGVSTGVAGSFEKKVWTSINAGETAGVTLKNGQVGVTELSFSVPNTVYGAWVHVAKKDSLPSSVSSFSGKAYKIVEITKGPALAKTGSYTDAAVKFKVEKAWLAENNLAKEAVALHHYADGKWAELETTVGEDDGTYVHYSAKTPGFSYFVIGQKSGAVAAAPEAEAAPAVPVEEAAVEAPAGEEPAMEKKGMSTGLLVALLAAAIVIVAVVLYLRKRR